MYIRQGLTLQTSIHVYIILLITHTINTHYFTTHHSIRLPNGSSSVLREVRNESSYITQTDRGLHTVNANSDNKLPSYLASKLLIVTTILTLYFLLHFFISYRWSTSMSHDVIRMERSIYLDCTYSLLRPRKEWMTSIRRLESRSFLPVPVLLSQAYVNLSQRTVITTNIGVNTYWLDGRRS